MVFVVVFELSDSSVSVDLSDVKKKEGIQLPSLSVFTKFSFFYRLPFGMAPIAFSSSSSDESLQQQPAATATGTVAHKPVAWIGQVRSAKSFSVMCL